MPKLNKYSSILIKTVIDSDITDPMEISNIMGNASVETAGFTRMHENHGYSSAEWLVKQVNSAPYRFTWEEIEDAVASKDPEKIFKVMYENRKDLGNTRPGDGYRYHGRGYFQYTGRFNYAKYGKKFGIDLINHPDIASEPKVAAELAIAYWKNAVSEYARKDPLLAGQAINGGNNGSEERVEASKAWSTIITSELVADIQSGRISLEQLSSPDAENRTQTTNHPAVQQLQETLNTLSYTDARGHALTVDGRYGPSTRYAVEAFQRDNNLSVDGVAGPNTWAALHAATRVASTTPTMAPAIAPSTAAEPSAVTFPQMAPPSDLDATAIRTLQQHLNTLHLADHRDQAVPVTGAYDEATRTAVMAFQQTQGLPGTGLADPATRSLIEARATIVELQQSANMRTAPMRETSLLDVSMYIPGTSSLITQNQPPLSAEIMPSQPAAQPPQAMHGVGHSSSPEPVAAPAAIYHDPAANQDALTVMQAQMREMQRQMEALTRQHETEREREPRRQRDDARAPSYEPAPHADRPSPAPQVGVPSSQQQANEAARAARQASIDRQIAHLQRIAEEKEAAQRIADERTAQGQAAAPTPPHQPAPLPDHLRDFRHPDHPMHSRYQHALEEVHYMEDQHKIAHGEHSERLAAAVVDRLHEERFGQLEKLQMRREGEQVQVVAHQSRPSVYLPEREVSLGVNQATARSVETVAHDWSKRAMPHLHEPTPVIASERLPDPRRLPAHDLRHPDHPQHALYQHVHAQVADAFAKAGVPRSEAQLEHATAATLLHAQIGQVDWSKPTQVALAQDPATGALGPQSNLSIRTPDRVFGHLTEIVPASAMQQAPETSFQHMGQVAQQQAQEWVAFEQQRAQANRQQHLYPTMPGGGPGGGP